MKRLSIVFFALFFSAAFADLYMLYPPGSNDRNNENNENRNNANRLFDSQNNAKGGFCRGPQLSFYSGSLLTVEWTNQHGCGNPNLHCNLVIQYICGSENDPENIRIRDGVTTNTIPNTDAATTQRDANNNNELEFGLHEQRAHYVACSTRNRNLGLFIADRENEGGLNEGRASAIFTRQNNNGNRHGFECAEERDYYPYWHPSPWKDVAVLTDKVEYCDFYVRESQNVKEKFHCVDSAGAEAEPNNQVECLQGAGNQWVAVPAHNIPAPVCVKAPWNRQNHLGNGFDPFASSFNMTIPTGEACIADNTCTCVLRMRYNITTNDMNRLGGNSANSPESGFIDYRNNDPLTPVTQDPIITQDGNSLELAMDTSQYGRTFQDRSHTFKIRPRPEGVSPLNRIFNLGVRGKRGNIVQAFPAIEYDFIPEHLVTRVGDFVHFQWTGCDNNPAGNAGEGTAQTDRSNIVQIGHTTMDTPLTEEFLLANPHLAMLETPELRNHFAGLGLNFANCQTYAQLLADNNNNDNQAQADTDNCFKLNNAPRYFDGGLIRSNKTGDYYFMSTRNNSFTNRGQKATWTIESLIPVWGIVLVVLGGVLCVASLGLAGAVFYAKSNPHSSVANMVNKF